MCCPNPITIVLHGLFWSLIGFVSLFVMLEVLSTVGYFEHDCRNILKVGPYGLKCCQGVKLGGYVCTYTNERGHLIPIRSTIDSIKNHIRDLRLLYTGFRAGVKEKR